jgi:sugar phosphate permease
MADCLKKQAFTATVFLLLSVPVLYLYGGTTSGTSEAANCALMALVSARPTSMAPTAAVLLVCRRAPASFHAYSPSQAGCVVNAPYALITTAVSADLGTRSDGNLMATVTGIVDGAGSLGAAAQGVLVGVISEQLGWSGVFYTLNVW